jgi:hypothetical protein
MVPYRMPHAETAASTHGAGCYHISDRGSGRMLVDSILLARWHMGSNGQGSGVSNCYSELVVLEYDLWDQICSYRWTR